MKALKRNRILTAMMFVCLAFISLKLQAQSKELMTEKDGFKWYKYEFKTANGYEYAAFDLNGNRLTPNVMKVFYYEAIQMLNTWEFNTCIGTDEKGEPDYTVVQGLYDKNGKCIISTDWMFNSIAGVDYLVHGSKYKTINGELERYDDVTFTKDGKYYAEGYYFTDFYFGDEYVSGNAAEFERKKKPMPQSKTTASYTNNTSSYTSSSSNTNSSTANSSTKSGEKNYDFSAVCSSGQTLYYKITAKSQVACVIPGNIEIDFTDAVNVFMEYYGLGKADDDAPNSYTVLSWQDYKKPDGNLIIPEKVIFQGQSYDVVEIGEQAFSGCDLLQSVKIPNSVTIIETSAFQGCDNLQVIEIGKSVQEIKMYAFNDCEKIKQVVVLAIVPPSLEFDFYDYDDYYYEEYSPFSENIKKNALLIVKCNMAKVYENSFWKDCFNTIKEDCSYK